MPSLNTGNAILSNPIKVDSSYNVGIGGAASGSFKLQVTGTTNLTGALSGTSATFSVNQSGATGIFITNSSTSTDASAATRFNNSGSTVSYIGLGGASRASYVNIGANILSMYTDNTAGMSFLVDAAGPMSFATNSTTRLTIASTGAATFSSSVKMGNASAAAISTNATGADVIVGSGTTSSPAFQVWDDNSLTIPRFIVTRGGNVGIGTSSPSTLLHLNATTTQLTLQNTDGGTNAERVGFFMTGGDTFKLISLNDNNTTRVDNILVANVLNGNVGIGTNSPSFALDVASTSADTLRINRTGVAGTGSASSMSFQVTQTNGQSATLGSISAEFMSNWGGDLRFYTKPANGTPNDSVTERMRITSAGSLTIGSVPDSSMRLSVQGAYDNWTAAFWGSTASGASYGPLVYAGTTSSDYSMYVANASGANWYFRVRGDGAVSIAGSLSKGSGSFRIDHPLESMTQTHDLVHSFVESPQANNIYRGKVELKNGIAKVNLDEVSTMTEGTFVALNREIHTYTSNETDWDAVRGKVEGNILTIECQNNQSNAIISWLVIGERQDKHMMDTDWTDENGRVIVEPLKPIEEDNNK